MKQLFTLSVCVLFFQIGFGQNTSNIIVFNETSEPFYLFLNGAMQNSSPETNVKVTGIDQGAYTVKITFKNTQLQNLSKNALVEPGKQYTLKIKLNKKGEYVLRYFGEVELQSAPSDNATTVHYTKESVSMDDQNTQAQGGQTTTITTETVVTETVLENNGTQGTNTGNESINMGVNAGGVNMDVNINVNGNGATTGTTSSTNSGTSTYSSTTTTTTTTTNSSGAVQSNTNVQGDQTTTSASTSATNSANSNCLYPEADITSVKAALEKEDFEDDKLALAKQITAKKCLKAEQVKEIAKLFDFEETKLEFTKYAYDFTYDQDNYYLVNEVFEFSSSKEELNNYISGK